MTLDWLETLTPVLSLLLSALVGGLLVHWFTSQRDARNEQRGRRVEHLISAYQGLMNAANRQQNLTPEQWDGLETAISDVILLGQQSEIDAAKQFLLTFASKGSAELDPLLKILRTSLREELALDKTDMPDPYNIRMSRPENASQRTPAVADD